MLSSSAIGELEERPKKVVDLEREYLNKLQVKLKEGYSRKKYLPRLIEDEDFKEQEIESTYVNLMLIKREEDNQWGMVYGPHENIKLKKTEINLEDIFCGATCKKSEKAINKVLIYGRAGIGKTTLCNYISYKWSRNELWKDEFDYVFWLPLRDLSGDWHTQHQSDIEKGYTLECFIKRYCLGRDKRFDVNDITKVLEEDRVLLILDGYDEIANFHNRKHTVVADVIDSAVEITNPRARVIMTSRPNAVSDGLKKSFDAEIENIGLKKEDIYRYVYRYKFGEQKKAEELDVLIRQNRHIEAIAQIPINLYLLCLVWDEGELKNQAEVTVTGLYGQVVDWFMRRHLKKSLKKQKYHDDIEIMLEELAYDGSKEKKIIIGTKLITSKIALFSACKEMKSKPLLEEQFESVLNENRSIGLFVPTGEGNKLINKAHEFIHLTFQEFFAARHIVKLLGSKDLEEVKEAIKFINDNKYDRAYERVILFVSGLVTLELEKKREKRALLNFWNVVLNGSIDLGYKKQMALVTRCLREGQCSETIPGLGELFRIISDSSKESAIFRGHLRISAFILYECGVLKAKLDSKNKDERIKTADLLCRLSIDSQKVRERVVEVLLEAVQDSYSTLIETSKALNKLSIVVHNQDDEVRKNLLLEQIKINSRFTIVRALEALSKLGIVVRNKDETVLKSLMQIFEDKDTCIRSSAAVALGSLKISNVEVVEQVKEVLLHASENDQEEHVRKHAEKALALLKIDHQSITPKDGSLSLPGNAEQLPKRSKVISENLIEGGYDVMSRVDLEDKETAIEVILALLEAIKGRDWDASKERAQMVLGSLRIENPEVVKAIIPVLLEVIKDRDPYVRGGASIGLRCLRIKDAETGKKIVLALLETIKDQDQGVRESAREALKSLRIEDLEAAKAIVLMLIKVLEEDTQVTRLYAIEALGSLKMMFPGMPMVVSALIEALKDKSTVVREHAVKALGSLKMMFPGMPMVVSALIEALKDDKSTVVREHAVKALGSLKMMFPGMPMVVSALIETLKDQSTVVREYAVEALGSLKMEGTDISEAVSALVEALKCPSRSVRAKAAEVLKPPQIWNTETTGVIALALLENLKDEDYNIRVQAAEILGTLKIESQELVAKVVDGLLEAFKDTNVYVRKSAMKAIRTLRVIEQKKEKNKMLMALLNALTDDDEEVRRGAASLLSLLDIKTLAITDAVVECLLCILKDPEYYIRASAASILGQANTTQELRKRIAEGLLAAVDDINEEVSSNAAKAFGSLNIGNLVRRDMLFRALKDTNKFVRICAVNEFGRLGTCETAAVRESVVPRLLEACQDHDKKVNKMAVDWLMKLGKGNPDMEKALVKELLIALKSKDLHERKPAIKILTKITLRSIGTQIEVIITLFDSLINGILPRDDSIINIMMLCIEQCASNATKIPFSAKHLPLLSLGIFRDRAIVLNENGMILYGEGHKVEFEFDPTDKDLPLKVCEHFRHRAEAEELPVDMLNSLITGRPWIQIEGINPEIDRLIRTRITKHMEGSMLIKRDFELGIEIPQRKEIRTDILSICDSKANVQTLQKYKGDSALIVAMEVARENPQHRTKMESIITSLCKDDAVLAKKDGEGNTMAHYAVRHNNMQVFKACVENGHYDKDTCNAFGINILHTAVYYNMVAKLDKDLGENNFNFDQQARVINYEVKYELTPIESAVAIGNIEGIKLLWDMSKSVKAKSKWCDKNILNVAVEFKQEVVLQYMLYQKEYGITWQEVQDAYVYAARVGNIRAMGVLQKAFSVEPYKQGSITKWSSKTGNPALHEAVAHRKKEVINWLMYQEQGLADGYNRDQKTAKELAKELAVGEKKEEYEKVIKILNVKKSKDDTKKFEILELGELPIKNLVMKGGGPKGAAYVGALEEFERVQVSRGYGEIERVAGTSAGAITGALYAIGYDAKGLKESIASINLLDLLDNSSIERLFTIKEYEEKETVKGCEPEERDEHGTVLKLLSSLGESKGICQGEVFEKKMEELIYKKTGKHNFTLGDLADKVRQGEPGYKELYVVTIDVSCKDAKDAVVILSTEDENYREVTLASVVRASMSIPGVFATKKIEYRNKISGEKKTLECIDGGVLYNYPIDIFDKVKFRHTGIRGTGEKPIYNEYTMSFCLHEERKVKKSQEHKEAKRSTKSVHEEAINKAGIEALKQLIGSLFELEVNENTVVKIRDIAGVFMNSESAMNKHWSESISNRTISISGCGYGLLDFDLGKQGIEKLMEAGRKAIRSKFNIEEVVLIEEVGQRKLLEDKDKKAPQKRNVEEKKAKPALTTIEAGGKENKGAVDSEEKLELHNTERYNRRKKKEAKEKEEQGDDKGKGVAKIVEVEDIEPKRKERSSSEGRDKKPKGKLSEGLVSSIKIAGEDEEKKLKHRKSSSTASVASSDSPKVSNAKATSTRHMDKKQLKDKEENKNNDGRGK